MASILGRGWAFPPHLNEGSGITMVEGEQDIQEAIFIILRTVPGERVMRPEFGCHIQELIFWPLNDQTAAIAERYVMEALQRWEPRINLNKVTATPNQDYGEMYIEIEYEIKNRHEVRSLTYPIQLIPS